MTCLVFFFHGSHAIRSSVVFQVDKLVYGILEVNGIFVKTGHYGSKTLDNASSNVGRKSLSLTHLKKGKAPWSINHIREVLVEGLNILQALV